MEAAEVLQKPKVEKINIAEPPTIQDPWQLMDAFYQSALYQQKFQSFTQDKQISADVSQQERDHAFLSSDCAEFAFLDFGFQRVDFKFAKDKYPQEFLDSLERYKKISREAKKMDRQMLTNDETIAFDGLRFEIHSDAARALVKSGIAPTVNIGRALASLVLVSQGLESREDAQRTTLDKIKDKYGRG
jgi:hypothetical protein